MATKPVVVGADGSEESLLAVEWAAMETKRHGLPLRIVSAPPFRPEQLSAEAARNLSAALDNWREKYPGVRVRQDVIRGHPARVLANYSYRADLVVIGRHGDPGVGSIQHALLDHARGPVAVIPSDG